MATHLGQAQDATIGEEIASTTVPQAGAIPPKRNAFADLMSPKKKNDKDPKSRKTPHSSTPPTDPARNTTFLGRDGLGAYIESPALFPPARVIYHDERWVLINDLFPKSSIHLLLLSRDPSKQKLHPLEAFRDQAFLQEVQAQVQKFRVLAAKELHRHFAKYSAQDQKRQKVIEALDDPFDEEALAKAPPGRDWSQSIISGIHLGPSMNHLHVHILSTDRRSECMKHRKHYKSFSAPFLVDVEEFPLDKHDTRRHPGRERFLDGDLKCWRCGRNFGNKFARLKEHLEEEFEEWRRE